MRLTVGPGIDINHHLWNVNFVCFNLANFIPGKL
jgi:hypothetical protein